MFTRYISVVFTICTIQSAQALDPAQIALAGLGATMEYAHVYKDMLCYTGQIPAPDIHPISVNSQIVANGISGAASMCLNSNRFIGGSVVLGAIGTYIAYKLYQNGKRIERVEQIVTQNGQQLQHLNDIVATHEQVDEVHQQVQNNERRLITFQEDMQARCERIDQHIERLQQHLQRNLDEHEKKQVARHQAVMLEFSEYAQRLTGMQESILKEITSAEQRIIEQNGDQLDKACSSMGHRLNTVEDKQDEILALMRQSPQSVPTARCAHSSNALSIK